MAPPEKTEPLLVCVDADVPIAGLLSRTGASHAILVLGELGLVRLVLPEAAVDEVRRNLPVQIHRPTSRDRDRATQLADVKDVPILAAAMGAGARLFVTHNIRHFRSGEGVRVVRPRTLIEEAREGSAQFFPVDGTTGHPWIPFGAGGWKRPWPGHARQPARTGRSSASRRLFDEMTKVAWQAEASAREEGGWQRKGATLSDKTARTEFGLTQDEIAQAIRAGKLHYRHTSIFGNPVLRLLRREIEALVKKTHGAAFLKDQQAKTELARIDRELRRLTTQIAALEERKSKLMAGFTR